MDAAFTRLQQGALEVIALLKTDSELAETNIVIVGGLALFNYLRNYRTTSVSKHECRRSIPGAHESNQDVDFLITAQGAPATVKKKLLAIKNTPFEDRAGVFFYKTEGRMIQIDMIPEAQVLRLSSIANLCQLTAVVSIPAFCSYACS